MADKNNPSLKDVMAASEAAVARSNREKAGNSKKVTQPAYKSLGTTPRSTTTLQPAWDYIAFGAWDSPHYGGSWKPTTTTSIGMNRFGKTVQTPGTKALTAKELLGNTTGAKPTYAPTYAPPSGAPATIADLAARRVAASNGVAPLPGAAKPSNVNISAPSGSSAPASGGDSGYQTIGGPGATGGVGSSQSLADMIAGNYAGTSQFLKDQIATANERYAQNKADVSNIFGTLSTIRAADANKIKQQFMDAINASQNAAAARTQQAQQQLAMGQQGAATAGAELGGGPTQMPTDSLTSQAVAQGIADANANQGTWNNLMNLTSAQAQADATNAASGIGLQQAATLQQMQRDYENQLQGLQGQQFSLQDQIAQAVSGVQANQSEMQQENYLQQLKNQGLTDVAKIRAAGQLAAKRAGGGSGGGSGAKSSSSKSISDFANNVNAALRDNNAFNAIVGMVSEAKSAAQNALGRKYHSYDKAKNPSKTDVIEYLNKNFGNAGNLLPHAIDYINRVM